MTPKEKAEDLFITYIYTVSNPLELLDKLKSDLAIQCALICVDEILNLEPPELSYLEPFSKSWWQEVKQELNKQD